MKQRSRKMIAVFGSVAFLIVYCLIAMALGGTLVVGRGMAAELGFYVLAGVLWLPPVMALIRWSSRPD